MAQIDLAIYRYAIFLRSLVYKKLRHDENPDDSRFVWDQSDEKTVAELAVYLNLETSSEFGSPLFYSQLLEGIQGLINNYNQVDKSTLPPPDVMAAYEEHLNEINQEIALEKSPTKQRAKNELRRRTANALPNVDAQTLEFIVDVIIGDSITTNAEESVPRATQIILDTATVTQQDVSTEEVMATVSAGAPIWSSNSPNFASVENAVNEKLSAGQLPEDKVTEAAVSFVTDYVSTAIFSPSSSTTPSPKFESSATTSTQSPPTAAKATQVLTDNQAQIFSLFAQLQQVLVESRQIEKETYKQLTLNPDLKKEDLPQTFAIVQRYVFPVVMAGHTIATQAGASAEAVKSIDKFLAHIGYQQGLKELGITNVSASARMAAQKAVANLDFSQLFGSTTSTQIFYSSRATSSPKMRYFLQDLAALEKIDFASVATVADKHFDLSGIDASLDKYFDNPDIRNLARGQNFAGDIVAKFVPAAKPIVALIKPINKLFFLVLEKVFGFTSLGVALNQLRKHRAAYLLVGGVGVGIVGLATGAQVLVFAGGISAAASFVNRANLFKGAVKVNATLASAAGAAVAAFTSFMTVSFVVLLSIPIAVALILFIINNSAYIVPQAVGTVSGGISPAGCNLQCLHFSGFSAPEQAQIESAACTILNNSCLASSLCAGGPININRVNTSKGYCGYSKTSERIIEIYDGGADGTKCSGLYTLSHELGHIYAGFDPFYATNYGTIVLPRRSTCLPTYELYDNNDPIACKVGGESGSGEDQAEIVAQYFVNINLLQQYAPQWELAQKSFASSTCSQPSSKKVYVLEGPIGGLKAPTATYINTNNNESVCSWANKSGVNGAINANFYKQNTDPVGWAGYNNDIHDYGPGTKPATKTFNGQSVVDSSAMNDSARMAVSGVSIGSPDSRVTGRVALAIKGSTAYLIFAPQATTSQLNSFVTQQLGVSSSGAIQLDGGSSATMCDINNSLLPGSTNAAVPVSIGFSAAGGAKLNEYDLP